MRISDWSSDVCSSDLIPVIHCEKCGAVPVPEDQLPVLLPQDVADAFSKAGVVHSPTKSDHQWRKPSCPQSARPATRQTDNFDPLLASRLSYESTPFIKEERRGGEGCVDTGRVRR